MGKILIQNLTIHEVSKNVVAFFHKTLDAATLRNFSHDVYAVEKTRRDYGCFIDDKMIAYGFLMNGETPYRRDQCKLGLVVHQDYQDQGVGSRLLSYLIGMAQYMGMRKLICGSYADNPRAVKFWVEHDFEIEGYYKNNENWDGKLRSMMTFCKFLK